MKLVVIGVGDCRVSRDPRASLVTYALGSCIAVLAHDPVNLVGGILHYMLPDSALNPKRAEATPAMFGDTGIPWLVDTMIRKGADKRRLTIRAAGGAQIMDAQGVFNIGKRNQLMLRRILWKNGLMLHAEETGGSIARTVRMEVGSGKAFLRPGGGAETEWSLQPLNKHFTVEVDQ